jgi:hypothetical protein
MRFDVPDAVKRVTKQDLVELSGKARGLHLGVGRRVDWLTEHVADASAGAAEYEAEWDTHRQAGRTA